MMYFGFFLCIYQIELFTGFLWLVECVVIFVFLLFLFFLKASGTWTQLIVKSHTFIYGCLLINFIVFLIQPNQINIIEGHLLNELNSIDWWDNYYEALFNINANDFMAFLISYYTLNSNLLILLIFIILIVSVICVNLNKIIRVERIQNIDSFLKIFNFSKNSVDFVFMRQQNLVDQENQPVGTRIFKKKTTLK